MQEDIWVREFLALSVMISFCLQIKCESIEFTNINLDLMKKKKHQIYDINVDTKAIQKNNVVKCLRPNNKSRFI